MMEFPCLLVKSPFLQVKFSFFTMNVHEFPMFVGEVSIFHGEIPQNPGVVPAKNALLHCVVAAAAQNQADAKGRDEGAQAEEEVETSKWVCLKMVSTPKPNGFADHYPY